MAAPQEEHARGKRKRKAALRVVEVKEFGVPRSISSVTPDPGRRRRMVVGLIVGVSLVFAAAIAHFIAVPSMGFPGAEILIVPILLFACLGAAFADDRFRPDGPQTTVPEIVVGADGVFYGHGGFIPYERIRGARCYDVDARWVEVRDDPGAPAEAWVVCVEIVDGEEVTIQSGRYWKPGEKSAWLSYFDPLSVRSAEADPVADGVEGAPPPVPVDEDDERANLVDAIERGLAAWTATQRGLDRPHHDVLMRGRRTGSEWLNALRAQSAEPTAPYRATSLDPDRLSSLLDDPGATASTRAAASIVLSAAGDTTASKKLRIVAQSTADPRLRIALEDLAEARSDDAIAEALEALDEAARTPRVRRP